MTRWGALLFLAGLLCGFALAGCGGEALRGEVDAQAVDGGADLVLACLPDGSWACSCPFPVGCDGGCAYCVDPFDTGYVVCNGVCHATF